MFFQFITVTGITVILNQIVHYVLHFFIRDKRSLNAYRLRISGRIKEHVSFSEQFFCSVHIDDRSRIHTGSYRECNPGRHVCLDQSGNDIDRRSLCCNNQMKSCSSCQLRQTADCTFHFSWRYHHKICKLIDNDNDLRQLLFDFVTCLALFYFCIESFQIPYVILSEKLITFLHLNYSPV